MKRIVLSLILAVTLIVTLLPLGVSAEGKDLCADITSGTNEGANVYEYSKWAKNIGSYLVTVKNGGYMTVIPNGEYYYIQYFSDDFTFTEKKKVNAELPIFGVFYETADNYYIVSGQSNRDENNETEVFRITKYDKNWKRLSSCGLFGENTYNPFQGGSCRVTECGKYLLIRTCHIMYKTNDGLNHQANVQIEIDTETMTVTDKVTRLVNSSLGYVSHSFNQFVKVENGVLYGVDHGDAYPRSVCLIEYPNKCDDGTFYGSKCKVYSFLDLAGEIGENYTGCEVGGFEITADAFLCAGKTIPQDGNSYKTSNIFVSSIDKATKSTTLNMITDYAEGTSSPGNPQLVKISDNRLVLMWMREGKLNYVTLDGSGKKTGEIKTADGKLSDCAPILSGNNIVWFSYNKAVTTFYTIGADDLTFNAQIFDYSHTYEFLKNNEDDTSTVMCSKCGITLTGKAPTELACYWSYSYNDAYTYWTTGNTLNVHPGDKKEFYLSFGDCDKNFKDSDVSVSDESVCKVDGSTVNIVGVGKAKITFTAVCNPNLVSTVTVNSKHTLGSWTVTKKASCAEEGEKTGVCTVCGETATEAIAKTTAHSYDSGKITTKSTCAKEGVKTYTCTLCGAKKAEAVAKSTVHKWNSGSITTEPTCITQGKKTYTCTLCGNTKTEIVAKSTVHNYDEGKVTTEPTYTREGVRTYTCTLCGRKMTENIAKLVKDDPAIMLGDADLDKDIDVSDARLALRCAIGLENYKVGSVQFVACDVDFNNEVTVADARLILRVAIHLDDAKDWVKK